MSIENQLDIIITLLGVIIVGQFVSSWTIWASIILRLAPTVRTIWGRIMKLKRLRDQTWPIQVIRREIKHSCPKPMWNVVRVAYVLNPREVPVTVQNVRLYYVTGGKCVRTGEIEESPYPRLDASPPHSAKGVTINVKGQSEIYTSEFTIHETEEGEFQSLTVEIIIEAMGLTCTPERITLQKLDIDK